MNTHLALALELTQIPSAAGREDRVIEFVRRWVSQRPGLRLDADAAGNLSVALRSPWSAPGAGGPATYITGHMDHPAFVVERCVAPGLIECSFRGGVMAVFFDSAPVTVHTADGPRAGLVTGKSDPSTAAGQHYFIELDGKGGEPQIGDIACWTMPAARIDEQGLLHTLACDDLAAVAAALCAFDVVHCRRENGEPVGDVRLLLTRAEEIGFIGAIAACRLGTMPKGSRVIALENSRAFDDSPVGGGPIVRVGDRMSVFTPWLTAACGARAEEVFGRPASVMANQTTSALAGKKPWQRKLMAGGACEASVFCHAGYDATCLCLPLGNYHNMPHLAELQAGTYDTERLGPARCAPEFIHTDDYLGLIELLVGLCTNLPDTSPLTPLLDKLYGDKAYVLGS